MGVVSGSEIISPRPVHTSPEKRCRCEGEGNAIPECISIKMTVDIIIVLFFSANVNSGNSAELSSRPPLL